MNIYETTMDWTDLLSCGVGVRTWAPNEENDLDRRRAAPTWDTSPSLGIGKDGDDGPASNPCGLLTLATAVADRFGSRSVLESPFEGTASPPPLRTGVETVAALAGVMFAG